MMTFSLWDTETHNLVGSFESRPLALEAVADTVAAYGVEAPEVTSLALLEEPSSDGASLLAGGSALVSLALKHRYYETLSRLLAGVDLGDIDIGGAAPHSTTPEVLLGESEPPVGSALIGRIERVAYDDMKAWFEQSRLLVAA